MRSYELKNLYQTHSLPGTGSAILFTILLLVGQILSCKNDQQSVLEGGYNSQKALKEIMIPGSINNVIQADSLFESIRIIPLETNDNCLISNPVKILVQDERIYIQNHNRDLFTFNLSGKFIQRIGEKGRGPGEYISLVDFEIDEAGNIYIFDNWKSLKYSNDGEFLSSEEIELYQTGIKLYPEQFIIKPDGGFIFWTGTNGIDENNSSGLYAMYDIDHSGEVVNRLFPLKYLIQNSRHRFRRYENCFLIDPPFGIDTIYCVDESFSIFGKYYIDFGDIKLTEKIPDDFVSLSDFKARIDRFSGYSIAKVTEIDDWLYFVFRHNGHAYYNYYSKKLNRVFTYTFLPEFHSLPFEAVAWKVDGNWKNLFIALNEPSHIFYQLDRIEVDDHPSGKDSLLISSLKSISIFDNPVLFVIEMKKY